ncbi:hypothetical protein FIV07_24840 [Mycobacterium sp. THAF192]|nr:hypothetical protein FIV07_24840 [Mycobacterium sp. THAF192]
MDAERAEVFQVFRRLLNGYRTSRDGYPSASTSA